MQPRPKCSQILMRWLMQYKRETGVVRSRLRSFAKRIDVCSNHQCSKSTADRPHATELDRWQQLRSVLCILRSPPWEMVDPLLDDLCAFCNDSSLPTVAQAAIAHAQFETIHPFIDGNGRVGRALIHLIFRRRRLTTSVSPRIIPSRYSVSQRSSVSGICRRCWAGTAHSEQRTHSATAIQESIDDNLIAEVVSSLKVEHERWVSVYQ